MEMNFAAIDQWTNETNGCIMLPGKQDQHVSGCDSDDKDQKWLLNTTKNCIIFKFEVVTRLKFFFLNNCC